MNATLSTRPNPIIHPPDDADLAAAASTADHRIELSTERRVGALDRIALHIGVALIRWGRRPRRGPTREELMLRVRSRQANEERARMAERRMRLLGPLR